MSAMVKVSLKLVVLLALLSMWALPTRGAAQVGTWCFEDRQGVAAEDSSGDNDGELQNMGANPWVPGQVGKSALRFDGEDDYVVIGAEDTFNFLVDFSWAAWIKTSGQGANGTIMGKSLLDDWALGDKAIFVGPEGDRQSGLLVFDVGNIGALVSLTPVDDGEWHHVALTVEYNSAPDGLGDAAVLYIDGQADSFRDDWNLDTPAEGGDDPAAEGSLKVGVASTFFPCEEVPPCYFRGDIDDVRVFDVALGPDEVAEIVASDGSDCPEGPAIDCDGADTHCLGLTIDGPDGDVAGVFTFTGNAMDDNASPITYTLTLENAEGRVITAIQADPVFELRVPAGDWTATLFVDDNGFCNEQAGNATCEENLTVQPLPPQRVALWCFDDRKAIVVADAVGGNDLELVDLEGCAPWTPGKIGNAAIRFNGEGGAAVALGPDAFDLTQSYTFAAWIKTGTGGTIFSKSPTEEWAEGSQALFVRDGLLAMDVGWVGDLESTMPVDDDQWHHVAMTVEMDTLDVTDSVQLYIDGQPDSLREDWDVLSAGPATGEVKIGFGSEDFPEPLTSFNGTTDHAQFWNFALGPDEIVELFEQEGDDCPAVDPIVCDDPADTTCVGITIEGPEGNTAGFYEITVEALDAGGDDIIYTFEIKNGNDVREIQTCESVLVVRLSAGLNEITVKVDDDLFCDDPGGSCRREIEVLPAEGDLGGLWCLNEEEGLETANQVGDNDGILTNMDEDDWVDGHESEAALNFDGIDDYVLVENSEDFDVHFEDHTWSCWFRTALDGGLLSKGPTDTIWDDPDHRGGRAMFVRDGTLTADVGWVGALDGATQVIDDEWHHAAMTVEFDTDGTADTMKLYVDGEFDAERSDWDIQEQLPNAPGDLKIGSLGPGFEDVSNTYFTGDIDDVRFFNFALDEEEVRELFEEPDEGCEEIETLPVSRRGDTDASGVVDISDPIFNLTFQFVGGIGELPCEDAADVDDSGVIDISDPIFNLTFQFVGGIAPPPPPGPSVCGVDPTGDALTCKEYPEEKCEA